MANFLRHIIYSYYPGIIFGLFILVMSIVPVSGEDNPILFSIPGIDKLVHAFIYAVFTVLLSASFLHRNPHQWRRLGLLLLSILVYSIIIEIMQSSLTEYRSGELMDVMANMTGILFGAAVVLLFRKIRY